MEKVNETKCQFFVKICDIDKALARIRKQKIQATDNRHERANIITDPNKYNLILQTNLCQQIRQLGWNRFLERHILLNLTKVNVNNLYSPISITGIEFIIKSFL